MSEEPPPDGSNCRSLRRLREQQFIPSALGECETGPSGFAAPSLQAAVRPPIGSLTLRLTLHLNARTRERRARGAHWQAIISPPQALTKFSSHVT